MLCKITKRTEHREITLDEFKRQKGYGIYKKFRQISKSVNFLQLFGGSPSVLSQSALEVFWTPEQVEEYLKDNRCDYELEEVQNKYKNYPLERQKYIAAATRIRTNFFKSYPGLLERCDREVKYAKEHGYCRSVFGGTKNQIQMLLRGSYDEKFSSGILRNIENVSKNYLAQQLEACIRGRAMREIHNWLKDNNYKSMVWNEVHDSIDYYIYKPEAKDVLAHIKHVEERKIPELMFNWVPLPSDCSMSDLTKGQYYKEENSPESFGIDWDDNLEFQDPDPFNVELSPELETEYFDNRKAWWASKEQVDPLARKIYSYRKEKGI